MIKYTEIHHTANGFSALDIESNSNIYGILLQDSNVFFSDVIMAGVTVSVKFITLDEADFISGRAVVFQIDCSIAEFENVDFFCRSLFESSIDKIKEKEVQRAIYIISRILKIGADLIGLVGELLFILYQIQKVKNYEIIYSWHNEKDDKFDFVFSDLIYEVKTTRLTIRKHMIKYQQHELLLHDFRQSKFYVSVLLVQRKVDENINGLILRITNEIVDQKEILDNFNLKIKQFSHLIKRSQLKFDIEDSISSIELFAISEIGEVDVLNQNIDKNDLVLPVYFRKY